jgi:hypothetical protein
MPGYLLLFGLPSRGNEAHETLTDLPNRSWWPCTIAHGRGMRAARCRSGPDDRPPPPPGPRRVALEAPARGSWRAARREFQPRHFRGRVRPAMIFAGYGMEWKGGKFRVSAANRSTTHRESSPWCSGRRWRPRRCPGGL